MLIFLPLGTAILILYLLKLRRKEMEVSSTFLWKDSLADIQANAPFQKLKKNLLLFLQLIALLLLAFVLARPYFMSTNLDENRIILVIDSSASMQSKDVSPTRFDEAKKRALAIADRTGPGDSVMVMTAGAKPRVEISFTSDKKALAAGISAMKPTDTSCDMQQAMTLALSLAPTKSGRPARVVVLSDGGFEQLKDLAVKDTKIDFIPIGNRCDNVGITALAARKTLSGEQQVFVSIQNFSDKKRTFNLEMYTGENLLDIREENMGPKEIKQEVLTGLGELTGRITVRLDIDDDLKTDDTASVYLTGAGGISVLMVSKGNIFLQNAINLDPRTRLVRTDSLPSAETYKEYDLVVFDRIDPPDTLPPGGYLLIGAASQAAPAELGAEIDRPEVIDTSQSHPVTAYTDFSTVRILKSRQMKQRPWAVPLIETTGGPLAVAGSTGGSKFVQLSWSILDSDLPLRISFPIFIANCLDWLSAGENALESITVRTGRPATIGVPPELTEITITGPDGSRNNVKVVTAPVIYDGTDLAGIYKVSGKDYKNEFACNLSSSKESDTTPRGEMKISEKETVASTGEIRTNRELYHPILLLLLLILGFEWYAYHRRI